MGLSCSSWWATLSPGQRLGLIWGVSTVVVLGVFGLGLSGAWWWDDNAKVFQHPRVVAPQGILAIWSVGLAHDPWPLTRSVYWLCFRYFELEPLGYRLVQVVLHASIAVAWGLFFQRLGFRKMGWVAAGIFLVHPVTVKTVLWVTEMTTLLAMLLVLVSAILFVDAIRGEGQAGRRAWRLSLLFWVLALMSKTAIVAFPVAWGVWATWVERRSLKKVVVYVLPYMVLALGATVWTMVTEGGVSDPLIHRAPEGLNTLWVAWTHIGFYIEKTLVPINLALLYPHSLDVQADQPGIWWRWNIVGILMVLACIFVKRDRVQWAIVIGIGSLLAPILGLVEIRHLLNTMVEDHFLYPALPLVLLGVLRLVYTVLGRRVPERLQWLGICILVLGLSCLTVHRSWICGDPVRIWDRETRFHPQLAPGWSMLAQAGLRPAWVSLQRLEQRFKIAQERERALLSGRVSLSDRAEEQRWIAREVDRIRSLKTELEPAFLEGRERLDRCLELQPGNFRARLVRARVRAVLGDKEGLDQEWVRCWKDMHRLPQEGWDPGVARQAIAGLKHGKADALAEEIRLHAAQVWPQLAEFRPQ